MLRRIARYLATRPDVLDTDERTRLADLGEHVPPMGWPDVRKVLMEGLGAHPSELFATVEPRPIASQAIAQVHRGSLLDGTPVRIKLVRPEAPDAVARAVGGADALAGLLGDRGNGERPRLAEEVAAWLDLHLDLTNELANLERLWELAADSTWEFVPRPYPDLCAPTVLVSEDPGGVPMSDVILAAGPGPPGRVRVLREQEIDPVRLARVVLTVNLRQAFRYRLFGVDLNPRNLVALPGDVISFVDFSHCGQIDPTMSEDQLAYLTAVFENDMERALDPPIETTPFAGEGNIAAFRRELLDLARGRAVGGSGEGRSPAPGAPSPAGQLLADVMRAAWLHHVRLPEGGLLLYRSIVTAQETARRLDPDAGIDEVSRRYLRVSHITAKARKVDPERIQSSALNVLTLLRDSPGQLQKILSDLADGSFSLNVWESETPAAERSRNRRSRFLVVALCAVSLAVLLTVPSPPEPLGVSLAWPLGAALAVLYAWLVLEWRRLR
ncbi:MAG TPA: AarF/ABC1/UbiB kinase family protein [Thermoleophilaceae bacterium]|jgi:ubiquinone biosynthesis protein